MNLPPLNALRAFEATARLLSFSRAGDELHVTHAAVSHQIKLLETWFGCRLFRREGKRIRLTREGHELSLRTSAALEDLADICRRIRLPQHPSILTVGCIPSIASRWLVPRLPTFYRTHPEIDLRVLYAHSGKRDDDASYDVLISSHQESRVRALAIRLFSQASRPVCSPHYLARHRGLRRPHRLCEAELLHDETRASWRDWFALVGIRASSVIPGPLFEDFNLLATAVIAGHGVALCPVDVFQEELRRGDLVVLSDIAINVDRAYFVTPRDETFVPAKRFTDWFGSSVRASIA